jgi:hypothetical protein
MAQGRIFFGFMMLFEKNAGWLLGFAGLRFEGERNLFGQNQFALGGNSQSILCVVMNNGSFAAALWKQGFCIQRRCCRWFSVAFRGSAGFQRRLGIHGGPE